MSALGERLLAAIYARPEDDEPRRVYADYLMSHGRDAERGEFIALQLGSLGPPTGDGFQRQTELRLQHAERWLGPLATIAKAGQVRWRRGFPSEADFTGSMPDLDRVLDEPAWATFESFRDPPPSLLDRPQLRALHTVVAARERLPRSLPERVRRLQVYSFAPERGRDLHWERSTLDDETFAPGLETLHISYGDGESPDGWAWIWRGPLGARLRALELSGLTGSLALPSWLRALREVPHRLDRVSLATDQVGCRLGHAEAGRRWDRLSVWTSAPEHARGHLHGLLESLPELGLHEVEIDETIADWNDARARAAIARLRLVTRVVTPRIQ